MSTREKQLLDLRSLDESASTVTPPPAPVVATPAASSNMGEILGVTGGFLTRELWAQFMRTFGGNYVDLENLIVLRESGVLNDEEFIALAVLLPSEMTAVN